MVTLRAMTPDDALALQGAFAAIGWDKPSAQFERYVAEAEAGDRVCLVAEVDGRLAGYCTLCWESGYPSFRAARIPEIVDLNVLPDFRRRGVATALMDALEREAATRGDTIGLGVGLYADYGPAQRMYVARGYLPDGRGIVYAGQPVEPGASVAIDDDACLMFTRRLD